MTPYYDDGTVTVHLGDCLAILPTIPDASVDAVVTDPPYELGFMGRAWDASGIAYNPRVWGECLRVLKPGGHLLAFGGTRTYHRLTVAIEDAGFTIRDSLHWIYGSGMPKGSDVAKAVDRAGGASPAEQARILKAARLRAGLTREQVAEAVGCSTDRGRQWEGWHTALKPAHEPIVLARAPLAGTVAETVLAHGTGALNIDACRIEAGRWPTNIMFSHLPDCGPEDGGPCSEGCPVAELDRQSGMRRAGGDITGREPSAKFSGAYGVIKGRTPYSGRGDNGGASRFFPVFRYQAKAPSRERPRLPDGTAHTTVKPLALMRWLVRLATPPGGVILDPFAGTGTTGEAAAAEGMRALLIEREEPYAELIKQRLDRPMQLGHGEVL
ncbi:MAG: hypothetical protein IRY90_17610 [Actinomadura rubrobrunea]|nr:hypothetical protein [Actinomadura rubrobrunea]